MSELVGNHEDRFSCIMAEMVLKSVDQDLTAHKSDKGLHCLSIHMRDFCFQYTYNLTVKATLCLVDASQMATLLGKSLSFCSMRVVTFWGCFKRYCLPHLVYGLGL